MRLTGLPPHVKGDARLVVLGSMPGRVSLEEARYYAHPRNRFWPIVERLFGVPADAEYEERVRALNDAGVGLWDVLRRCERADSLDASIVVATEEANDFAALARRTPGLRMLAFNGQKAWRAFERHVGADAMPGVELVPLPSTSPANARFSLDELERRWEAIGAALR